jgi:hypothetical protein
VGEDDPVLTGIDSTIMVALFVLVLGLQLWALVDCAIRSDSLFPAADKRTKGFWLAMTIGAIAVYLFVPFISYFAVVPSLVYLVDVRPALREVGSGGKW